MSRYPSTAGKKVSVEDATPVTVGAVASTWNAGEPVTVETKLSPAVDTRDIVASTE